MWGSLFQSFSHGPVSCTPIAPIFLSSWSEELAGSFLLSFCPAALPQVRGNQFCPACA